MRARPTWTPRSDAVITPGTFPMGAHVPAQPPLATVSPHDTWAYALRLPHNPRAARVARMTVRTVLHSHGRHEVLDAVELLVSELVTNAYRHARGPASLRLTALGTAGCESVCGTVTLASPPLSARRPGIACPSRPRTTRADAGCASCRSTPTAGEAGPSGTGRWIAVPGSCCGSRWVDDADPSERRLPPPMTDRAGAVGPDGQRSEPIRSTRSFTPLRSSESVVPGGATVGVDDGGWVSSEHLAPRDGTFRFTR